MSPERGAELEAAALIASLRSQQRKFRGYDINERTGLSAIQTEPSCPPEAQLPGFS